MVDVLRGAVLVVGAITICCWIVEGIVVAWLALSQSLDEKVGIGVKARWRRPPPRDVDLERGIWWERSWGPVFVGGWYREISIGARVVNRWSGLGRASGPCITAFRRQTLTALCDSGCSTWRRDGDE